MLRPTGFHGLGEPRHAPFWPPRRWAVWRRRPSPRSSCFGVYLTQGPAAGHEAPWSPRWVISGLLFGALHIPNGWPQAVNAALFGVVLAPDRHPHRGP